MRKLIVTGMAALLALTIAVGPVTHVMAQAKVIHVTLIDENGSGEDGSSQITDQGDGTTKVELIMTNEPQGASQPAGIRAGTCINPDADVAFALNPITDLKSTTTITTPLSTLLNSKYVVVVAKSASDNTIISCALLPSAAVANGQTLTMDQVMSTLLDEANELQGTIQQKEVDASANAYNAFHGTFTAHENDIKTQSPPDQEEVDAAMIAVNAALGAGNWDTAATAAATLVQKVKDAQDALASIAAAANNAGTGLSGEMATLQSQASDLVRETGNKDAAGAAAAYTAFNTTFTASENDIKAQNAGAQSDIAASMNEVNDGIQAGDWAKASAAANELMTRVNETTAMFAGSGGNALPNGGGGDTILPISTGLMVLALGLLALGVVIRRKPAL